MIEFVNNILPKTLLVQFRFMILRKSENRKVNFSLAPPIWYCTDIWIEKSIYGICKIKRLVKVKTWIKEITAKTCISVINQVSEENYGYLRILFKLQTFSDIITKVDAFRLFGHQIVIYQKMSNFSFNIVFHIFLYYMISVNCECNSNQL